MFNKKLSAAILSTLLALTMASLMGCGSLASNGSTNTGPKPAEPKELTNLVRADESYASIETFHAAQDQPKYTPDNKGYLYEKSGWVYIHIEGSPQDRGYQHGWLLADYIQHAIDLNRDKLRTAQGIEWNYLKENALRMWQDKINPEYVAELQGIVSGASERGATFDYADLLTWNGLEEISSYWLPSHIDEYYQSLSPDKGMVNQTSGSGVLPLPAATGASTGAATETATGAATEATTAAATENNGADDHCSAFIATGSYTEDGTIVMAHNSFVPFEDANFLNVSIDIVPEAGQHFAMQSQPGYIHSMSDIYSSESLLVSETTLGGFSNYVEGGIPEFNRIRQAIQYAKTLDQFTDVMLYGNNGGYANTWLVGQLDTNEIMQLELGLKFYNVQKSSDGAFAGFNAPEDARIRNLETTDSGYADIRRHQGARQMRIPQLLEQNKGKITAEIAKTIIADHYDVYLEKINPSSRTVCSHYELDKREYMSDPNRPLPYQPRGAVDGTIVSSNTAQSFTIIGRWGTSCGKAFGSTDFFTQHSQFNYLKPYIFDRPSEPWTELAPIQSS